MRIRLAPADRRMRWLAAAWILLFAADVLISAPVCKKMHVGAAHAALLTVFEGARPASAVHAGSAGQGVAAAPNPSNPVRHHGHATARGSDRDCDFCLLTGIANTALPWLLTPPLTLALPPVPAPSPSVRDLESRLLSIRAPPAA